MQEFNRGIVFLLCAAAMLTAAHDETAQALGRVLEVEPDHARAHYLLGTALFNTGQTELAADHLRRFVELAPDDPDVAIAEELLAYVQ
jgi:Flp pilus assembly protein TadD